MQDIRNRKKALISVPTFVADEFIKLNGRKYENHTLDIKKDMLCLNSTYCKNQRCSKWHMQNGRNSDSNTHNNKDENLRNDKIEHIGSQRQKILETTKMK